MLKSKKVQFTTAMDAEAKKAGNVKQVEFVVSFVGVSDEDIRKAAIANQVVGWQSQIRNNWDKFIKGDLPKVVTFGQPLFKTERTVTRKPTNEEIKQEAINLFKGKTPEEIMYFVQFGKFKDADDVK